MPQTTLSNIKYFITSFKLSLSPWQLILPQTRGNWQRWRVTGTLHSHNYSKTEHLHRHFQLTLHTPGPAGALWSNICSGPLGEVVIFVLFFYLFVSPPPDQSRWITFSISRALARRQSIRLLTWGGWAAAGAVHQIAQPGESEPSAAQGQREEGAIAASQTGEQRQCKTIRGESVKRTWSDTQIYTRLSTVESSVLFTVKSTHFSEKSHFNLWHFQIKNN